MPILKKVLRLLNSVNFAWASTLLLSILPMEARAFEINSSNKTIQELSSAYSFLLGQKYLFDHVNKTQNNALLEEVVAFNHAFPSADKKIHKALVAKIGIDAVSKIETDLIPIFEEQIKNSPIDADQLEAIRNIIRGRVNGEIPDSILQPILYTTFSDDQIQLLTRGYSKKYTTSGHAKAKGISLDISVPITWRNAEGNRPNVVQKWNNQNGNGPLTTMILIHDLGLNEAEKAMLSTLQNDSVGWSNLVNEISSNLILDKDKDVEKSPIKIDQKLGFLVTSTRADKALNIEVEAYIRRYMLLVDDKFVTFQCSGPKQKLDVNYTLFTNICDVVANSIVFPSQYIQNSSSRTLPTSSNENKLLQLEDLLSAEKRKNKRLETEVKNLKNTLKSLPHNNDIATLQSQLANLGNRLNSALARAAAEERKRRKLEQQIQKLKEKYGDK